MTTGDQVFAGSIPEIYERYLVPLIFQPYADELATRVARLDPTSILETAAGTGVLTRALDVRLPAHTRIVATDLNQPMLDQARVRMPDSARVDWRQADALKLPFEDQTFDVVACQFGVMFFPDKRAGYAEARRVLKQGGRFFFSVWDRIAENEFADAVTEALAGLFPDDPPRFLARTPHGHHDIDRIRADLTVVGFTEVSVEAVDCISKAQSARDPAVGFCQGTPLRSEIETRDVSRLQQATDHAASALAKRFGNGPVEGRIRALVISAQR